jgi:uncharacterized protein (DUF1684 family)
MRTTVTAPTLLRLHPWIFLLVGVVAAGCGWGGDSSSARSSGKYDPESIVAARRQKDSQFRSDDSPIPAPLRHDFTGLAYYPPNEKFAPTASLEKFPSADTVSVAASGGENRKMLRYGRVRFFIDGQEQALTVYKHSRNDAELFIPFRDATNGKQTYESGRYIDLQEKPGEDHYLLDFNYAYSPYCAYNPDYSCPLVPRENILTVAIEAGEKITPGMAH